MADLKLKIKGMISNASNCLKQHPSALIFIALAVIGVYIQWLIIGLLISPIEVFSMEAI